jgi:hypothetical protein
MSQPFLFMREIVCRALTATDELFGDVDGE